MQPRILLSPPHLAPGSQQALADCLASGWIAPVGPQLAAFEAALCQRVGRQAAVVTSSGTAALHLALRVAGVQAGDSVLCSSLTFVAGASPIVYLGATPVFLGSEPTTWCLDPTALEDAITALHARGTHPKALICTQLYGRVAEMPAIEALCHQHGIVLIEDAAEALGASHNDRPAGSFGRLSLFSFNGNKLITTGGGGALLTDDPALASHACSLASQARLPGWDYHHADLAYTYRLSSVLAALGTAQLPLVDAYAETRRQHYAAYRAALADLPGVSFLPSRSHATDTCWLSTLNVDPATGLTPRSIGQQLLAQGIETRPVWQPMHRQPLFSGAAYFGDATADWAHQTGLCLPSGSSLTEAERDEVIAALRAFWP